MGKGSAPAAPDPVVSANAQSGMNKETAIANANLGHVNQYTPFGNLTYQQTGTNSDGTPQYSSNTTLTPQMQQLLNSQMAQDNNLTSTGNNLISQVQNQIGQPINTDGMTPVTGGMSGNQFQNWQNGFKTSAGQAAQGQAGHADVTMAQGGPIQTSIQGAGDLQGQFNRAQQAALNQQMGYLRPQQQDTANQLTDSLRQQGITQESNPAAYQHAMDQQNRNNTFQNQQAYDSSYNSGLASSNQLFNQALGAGNFANSAQQQGFNQSAFNATSANNASLANAGFDTQASMQNASMQNQNNQFNVGANNNAQTSIMAGYGQNAGMNNAANSQQMQNLFALRNAPMNELSSIRSATPVSQPQFQAYGPAGMNSPNLMNAQQQAYQGQLGSYNNQVSGMYGLGSSALTAGAMYMMMSDIRVKKDVEKIGQRDDGLGIYRFRYKWDSDQAAPHVGVMAQEVEQVRPSAVKTMPNGFKAVNYSML